MQSLLNYKAGVKRDPVRHNSVFLHDSPITARRGGAVSSPRQRKEERMCEDEWAEGRMWETGAPKLFLPVEDR